jgi:dynein heavy chain, axonemal
LSVHHDLRLKLESLSKSVIKSVRVACDEVVDQFLKTNNIAANHKMTFMERAALRAECKRLTRFLRSVDIMMTDFLWSMVLEAMENLVRKVESGSAAGSNSLEPRIECSPDMDILKLVTKREENDWKAPLFRVVAEFKTVVNVDEGEEVMLVTPSLDQLGRVMDRVISETVDVVGSFGVIFSSQEMVMYVMPDGTDEESEHVEKLDLGASIRGNALFINAKEVIHRHLRHAFYAVKEYTGMFEPYRQLFLDNMKDSTEVAVVFENGEVDAFMEAIAAYKAQIDQFREVPRYADVGVIFVDSDDMRSRMIPSPLACLQAIRAWLPELAQMRAQELLDTIGAMNPVIASEPSTVEAYVNKKKVKDTANEGADRYRDHQAYVRSLVNVLDDNQWTVPDNVKVRNTCRQMLVWLLYDLLSLISSLCVRLGSTAYALRGPSRP